MEETNTQDFAERYVALEERVRRLAIQAPDDWEWYSLRDYMCAGWIDAYAAEPYRYDDPDGAQALGYFDTGHSIVFTGTAMWDPNGWWVTPPVPVGTPEGGSPDIKYDAQEILRPGYDAFQTFVGHGHEDAGRAIPYRIPNDTLMYLDFPVVHTTAAAVQMVTGLLYGTVSVALFSLPGTVVEGFGPTGGTNFALGGGVWPYAELLPAPIDSAGFTHYGIPERAVLIFQGQSFPYDTSIGRMY